MNDLCVFVAVVVAGGLGSVLRYLVGSAIPAHLEGSHPWAVWAVNVTGSFALGMLTGLTAASSSWYAIAGTGLIGGYTTFSAASLETVSLIMERRWIPAVLHSFGMLFACVLAAAIGIAVTGP